MEVMEYQAANNGKIADVSQNPVPPSQQTHQTPDAGDVLAPAKDGNSEEQTPANGTEEKDGKIDENGEEDKEAKIPKKRGRKPRSDIAGEQCGKSPNLSGVRQGVIGSDEENDGKKLRRSLRKEKEEKKDLGVEEFWDEEDEDDEEKVSRKRKRGRKKKRGRKSVPKEAENGGVEDEKRVGSKKNGGRGKTKSVKQDEGEEEENGGVDVDDFEDGESEQEEESVSRKPIGRTKRRGQKAGAKGGEEGSDIGGKEVAIKQRSGKGRKKKDAKVGTPGVCENDAEKKQEYETDTTRRSLRSGKAPPLEESKPKPKGPEYDENVITIILIGEVPCF